MAYKTAVITSEDQVPAGYVRVHEITKDKSDQNRLFEAHGNGLIPAVKVMRTTSDRNGPVWVDRNAAERVIAAAKDLPSRKRPTPIETPFMLSEIDDKAERIARAVERIASSFEVLLRHTASVKHLAESICESNEKQEFSCS